MTSSSMLVLACLFFAAGAQRLELSSVHSQGRGTDQLAQLLFAHSPSAFAPSVQTAMQQSIMMTKGRRQEPIMTDKFLTRLEQSGLLSKVAEAGLLTKASQAGLIPFAEQNLPLVEKLGLLSILEFVIDFNAGTLVVAGLALIAGPPLLTALDLSGIVTVPAEFLPFAIVTGSAGAVLGVALIAVASIVSDLQTLVV